MGCVMLLVNAVVSSRGCSRKTENGKGNLDRIYDRLCGRVVGFAFSVVEFLLAFAGVGGQMPCRDRMQRVSLYAISNH